MQYLTWICSFLVATMKKDRGSNSSQAIPCKTRERHYRKTVALVLAQGDQMAVYVTYISFSHYVKIRGLQKCIFGILGLTLLCLNKGCVSVYLDTAIRV